MDSPRSDRKCWARLPARAPPGTGQVDALDDQGQLGRLDRLRRESAVGRERRAEAAFLEPLGPHREAVAIPVHDPDAITALGKEDEEVTAERVVAEHVPNEHHQAVWALAPVDGDANHGVVEGIARAYDAATLDPTPIDPQTPRLKLLWDSRRSGMIFNHAKFVPPVVADGRLFVPTYDGRVDMYMLNP